MRHRQKPTVVVSDILNNYLDWVAFNYSPLDADDLIKVFDTAYCMYLDKQVPEYSSAVKALGTRYLEELSGVMKKYSVDKPDLLYEICMLYLNKATKKGEI